MISSDTGSDKGSGVWSENESKKRRKVSYDLVSISTNEDNESAIRNHRR
nr:hypothetical protein [uncultured Acetatifactor sp.]